MSSRVMYLPVGVEPFYVLSMTMATNEHTGEHMPVVAEVGIMDKTLVKTTHHRWCQQPCETVAGLRARSLVSIAAMANRHVYGGTCVVVCNAHKSLCMSLQLRHST